ncbi:hypothetical protein Ga0061067_102191 [Pannonibacter indicus]|uniref:Uncharacterized protein n=1 Tax=Pannonibacter indicus TaxID=466044 RepID=A0A0K6HPT9_9HYPH|nr:hypothetical protein Ga0061067_102191 [Pannonibacter indicus]
MSSSVNGIGVSHYPGTVNWAQVAAGGVSFTFIKATKEQPMPAPCSRPTGRAPRRPG